LNLSADSVILLVLASASARRRDLLSRLGVGFQVCPADVDESPWPGETPLETQLRITRDKARTAQTRLFTAYPALAKRPVVACDTTVLLDGEMLNKPAGPEDARRMLRRLRGRTHQVQSVIVVRRGGHETAEPVSTRVLMRDYDDEEIEAYIATGDPFDKAGSYAVQHPLFPTGGRDARMSAQTSWAWRSAGCGPACRSSLTLRWSVSRSAAGHALPILTSATSLPRSTQRSTPKYRAGHRSSSPSAAGSARRFPPSRAEQP
jgi:septum formation protein